MAKIFEFKPTTGAETGPSQEELENDHKQQEKLREYLASLDKQEALRTVNRDEEEKELTLVAEDLSALDLKKVRTVMGRTAERIMFDELSDDLQRRGLADEETLKALNNYLQYAKSGKFADLPRSGLALIGTYVSRETEKLREQATRDKIKILSDVLGDERQRIDEVGSFLSERWDSDAWKDEILESEKEAEKDLRTRGPKEFLQAAKAISGMKMGGASDVSSLQEMRSRVRSAKQMKEAEDAYESAMRGKSNPFDVKGHQNPYLEGMASAGRSRMDELNRIRVGTKMQFMRDKIRDRLRQLNLRAAG
jgi:hypothetical protein